MKKITKVIIILGFIVGVPIVYYQQSRSVYCLPDGKCITVWKRIGGTCYIIPRKYYGITEPSDNFIRTTNVSDLDLIWKKPEQMLVVGKEVKIFNRDKDAIIMVNYNEMRQHNDSLYLSFDGSYHRYKKEVDYIYINIKEGYAKDKTGKKL